MRTITFVLACLACAVSGRRVRMAAPHLVETSSDELRHLQRVRDIARGHAVTSGSHRTSQSLTALRQALSQAPVRTTKPCTKLAKMLLAFNGLTHSSYFLRHGLGNLHVSQSPRISLQLNNASDDGAPSEDPLRDSLLSGEESAQPSIAASTIAREDTYRNVTAELITDSVADAANKNLTKEETEKAMAALERLLSAKSGEKDNPFADMLKEKGQQNTAFENMLQERRDTDAWLTDRVPVLLKIRRIVLPVYFFYCWRRGWIGTCGLLQGGLFADSYFDMLVVPARTRPESLLLEKPFWMVKFYIDNAIRLMYFAFDVIRRKTTLEKGITPYKLMWEQFRQATTQQEEQQQGSAQTANATSAVDVETEPNKTSEFLGGFFSAEHQVNASDKFIIDRFPVLQRPKKLLLLFFYGYAFQKGWIEQFGLIFGFLFSNSYFDALAVPLRIVPTSPFFEQPLLVTQALVNFGCGTLGFLFRLMRGENPLAEWLDNVRARQAEMEASQNSTEEVAPANETAAEEFSWASVKAQMQAHRENQTASSPLAMWVNMMGQQGNASDAFITNRIPALKKPKRAILILFYTLCFYKGWIGKWGLVYGAVATRSYLDMIAVPLRLHLDKPSYGWFYLADKPFYLAQLYLDYFFRFIDFILKLLRGENPFAGFQERMEKKMKQAFAEGQESKLAEGKETKQSADGATVIDVEATTVEKSARK